MILSGRLLIGVQWMIMLRTHSIISPYIICSVVFHTTDKWCPALRIINAAISHCLARRKMAAPAHMLPTKCHVDFCVIPVGLKTASLSGANYAARLERFLPH